jgi:hypothetical protein
MAAAKTTRAARSARCPGRYGEAGRRPYVTILDSGHPAGICCGGLLVMQTLAFVLAGGHTSSGGGIGGLLVILLILWLVFR